MTRAATPDQILRVNQPQFVVAPRPKAAATAKADNDMLARVNRCVAAMSTFASFVYTLDDDGNHKYLTAQGFLEITAPFTRSGYKHYLISRSEGRALNIVYNDLKASDKAMPWVLYDELATCWYVDIKTYPKRSDAVVWLKFADLPRTFGPAWHKVTDKSYAS